MKKSIIGILSALILAGLTMGFVPGGSKSIALAVKVIHDVSKKNATIDWATAKKGDFLYSGDQVRTAQRSVAIVKFLDNSMLRVRESSELKLFGEDKDGVFNKTVNVTKGEFSFDIQKQKSNEKFTFSSPTSVAAIRGTRGTFEAGADGDMLVLTEGIVNFLNAISNKAVEVTAGQTAISNADGTISVRVSTPAEVATAQDAINAGLNSGPEKRLDLEVKDKEGTKKLLRIRYHG